MTQRDGDHPDDGWDTGPGLLEAMWRFRRVVAVAVAVAVVVGFAASFAQTRLYEGEARLILADPRNAGVFRETTQIVIDPSRYTRNQAERMTSTPVLTRAAELEGGRVTVADLQGRVTAEASANLDLITIRALDPTPEGAASLADAVAEAYQQVVAEEVRGNADAAIAELAASKAELQARIDALEAELVRAGDDTALRAERDAAVAQLVTISSRAEQIGVDAALYGSGVELFERSEVPESPAQPQPLRNAALAGVLALLGAGAWAWWQADRNETADGRHDPAPILGAPLLGEIPDFGSAGVLGPVPAATHPGSPVSEAYRFVLSSIDYAIDKESSNVILVTSPLPGDGKSSTAANLAIVVTQPDRRVLLMDADERMRTLSRLFTANGHRGMTDLATVGDREVGECVSRWSGAAGTGLALVPAGSTLTDPAAFFRTLGFRKVVDRVREMADLVVVDSPPLLTVADASAIAGHVDGIVLVVDRGTPLRVLEDAARRLAFVGTPLVGYVFNRADSGTKGYGYGYYRYGYHRENGNGKVRHDSASEKPRRAGRAGNRRSG